MSIRNLKETIQNNYNINIKSIDKNFESTDRNVYIIDNKYVVKIYNNLLHTNSMVQLHTYLYNNKLNVPQVINNKEVEKYTCFGNNYIVVYTFIDGEQISKINNLDKSIIEKIAYNLYKLHNITTNKTFELKSIPFDLEINVERLSVIHFDLNKNNIFYNKEISFIDFDDALYGPSVCDVAITIAFLFFSKKRGINKEGLTIFMDAYYKNNDELRTHEEPFIKQCALRWINYFLTNENINTSLKDSFIAKYNLIKNYL